MITADINWTLVALIFTWTVVVPYLVLFPPQLIFVRRKLRAGRELRAVRAIKLDPKWQMISLAAAAGSRPQQQEVGTPLALGSLPRWIIPAKCSTVIALVNRKSGGQLGAATLTALSKLLHPGQIFDLSEQPDVGAILRSFTGAIKILVCGGDGTVSWAMDAATRSGCKPPIAILPLGTGNDLSRSLGWGSGFGMGEVTVEEVRTALAKLSSPKAPVQMLDRWSLTFTPRDGSPAFRKTMINYFSFGVDAEISLKFHHERLEYPERFSSQTKNVVKYAMLGFEAAFDGRMLEGKVQVFAGAKQLELMDGWKGAIVSNVPCYHGGKNFWGSDGEGDFGPALMDDGRLEVMGLAGTFHIGLCNIHVDSALRVGQHGEITVVIKEECAVQVDGEPYLQAPCTVNFSRIGQYPMLRCDS